MNRLMTIVTTLMLLLCTATLVLGPALADNEDPDAEGKIFGDWTISLAKTYKDRTIEVSGNLNITTGGSLVLDNVTLIMNSTHDAEYAITVEIGGSLQIINGSVVTNNATFDRPYYFVVEYGGSATVRDSMLRRMGNETLGQDFSFENLSRMGLLISANAVTIQDSIIADSFTGTICTNLVAISPNIINTTYENNSMGMALTLACTPVMNRNTYIDNGIGLSVLLKNQLGIEKDHFDNNSVAIGSSISSLNLKDLVIQNSSGAGIVGLAGSTIKAENVTFVDNGNATYADNSTVDLVDCTVTGSAEWDFFLDNVSLTRVLNTTIDDRDGIMVNDTDSHFELLWYLDVKAEYGTGDPVVGALINLTDLQEDQVLNTATDGTGWIDTATVMELMDEGEGVVNMTPHDLTAEKDAFWNETQITVDHSMSLVLRVWERDLIAPGVTILWPTNGTHLNTSVINVTGTAEDNEELALVEVRLDDGNWTNGTGLEDWYIELVLPEDGTYDICARATDLSENEFLECIEVVLDTARPTLSVSEPLDGQYFNYSQMFVRGTTDADDLIVNDDAVSVFNGSFSYPFTLSLEGANDITVMAMDLAGNRNSTNLRVYRDLIAPSISVLSPEPGSTVDNTTVTIAGNVTDSLGVTGLLVSSDGQTWIQADINFTNSENRTGAFTGSLTLPEGESTIHLKASDRAGNTGRFEFNLTVDLPDVTSPEVDIVTPVDGDRLTRLTITVTGTASDDEAVASVEISTDNATWRTVTTTDGFSTWSAVMTLVDGANTIYVKALDEAGNMAEDRVTVTAVEPIVDEVDPVITITSPKNNKVVTKGRIVVKGEASDNVGVKSVLVSATGIGDGATWVLADHDPANGTWEAEVTLAKGWNEIAVRAIDDAGNNDTTIITVRYQEEGSGGLDYTLLGVLLLVLIVMVVVYVLTLPGRKRARMAAEDGIPDEDDEDDEDEGEEE